MTDTLFANSGTFIGISCAERAFIRVVSRCMYKIVCVLVPSDKNMELDTQG
jgi:hypothetical protein